jgi:hypothetical protein
MYSQTIVVGELRCGMEPENMLSYASISLQNTTKGILSDSLGRFEIFIDDTISEGNLSISCLGYQSLDIRNIKIDNDTVDLGVLHLFEDCCSIYYDYFCSFWQIRCRRIQKKMNNPSEKFCNECRMNVEKQQSKYKYKFNGFLYEIDNGVIDLKKGE